MAGTIQQLNIQYQPVEDRLILSVLAADGSEIRLWLTRRYTRLLLQALDQTVETTVDPTMALPTASKSEEIKAFEHEAAVSSTNFKEAYRGGSNTTLPLGALPLLVSKIDIQRRQRGDITLSLGEERKEGKQINMDFNRQMVHSLLELLASGAESAEWNLSVKPASALSNAGYALGDSAKVH